ncbi:hypothetical protein AAFF_G00356760 [Aldrovandia affinis]|uniref:CBM21 domain-containing protein n=1 Tax=Aldrovandia affinis TaxID=143900 RepID=A0AAD7T9Q3_9TELE|nr:hypothetical protein AAFF_G00356760 [Aldrovandia affinis]
MESAGEPRLFGACNSLKVVDANYWDVDEDEAEGHIKAKSSPLPRRRGSESSDDSEPEPPSARPRKVQFADAFGLSLVTVKEFDSRDASGPVGMDALEGGARDSEEYFLSSLFTVPSSAEELLQRLGEQKCELECVELLPGTTALRGIIRVLNLSFDKMVYVRTSLDGWCTHFDLLAEFVPGSSDGETDRFTFKLTLVPPFEKEGAKVEFCLRYETSGTTFWANNNGMNYVLFCHQRAVRDVRDKQHEGNNHKNKKSCLKLNSKDSSLEENPKVIPAETPAYPVETFARWSDSINRPPIACKNPESSRGQPVSEGRANAREHARTEITDQCNCREKAKNLDIAQGDMVEGQTSGKKADGHKMARHRLWTDGTNIQHLFPSVHTWLLWTSSRAQTMF